MCDNEEITLEELQEIGGILESDVENLETLEIFSPQKSGEIHLAYKTDKSENIVDLMKFINYNEGDEFKDANKFNSTYKGTHFSFNRVVDIKPEYTTFVLISKENVNGEKKGMIIIADNSPVIFVSTCKASILGKVNLDLITTIFGS